MTRPAWLTAREHDEIVREIAASRFPFPDQTDWPASYQTITNADREARGVGNGSALLYPDIVIVDATTDAVVEIGEVEVEVDPTMVVKWRFFAAHTRVHPESNAPHFFIYVPEGLEHESMSLLTEYAVPHGGLRTFSRDATGALRVTPVTTAVDPKDHRPT